MAEEESHSKNTPGTFQLMEDKVRAESKEGNTNHKSNLILHSYSSRSTIRLHVYLY